MDIITIFFLFGITAFVIHFFFLFKLNKYLKINYPFTWDKLILNSFFGVAAGNLPFYRDPLLGGNYFKEIYFIFSKDDLKDKTVSFLKNATKIFFLMYIFFWLITFILP